MAKVIECESCGAFISSKHKYCPECNAKVKKSKWWLILIPLAVILFLMFGQAGGDGTSSSMDRLMDISQANEKHVISVKYGSPQIYPDITYADAFESFFGSPTWKYFQGSQEGADELIDVVEFTGTCLFQGKEVKARMQFTFTDDGESFGASYLSFNDVPQSRILIYSLIEKAFSEYQDSHDMAKQEIIPLN